MIPTNITLQHVITIEPETRQSVGLGLALVMAAIFGITIARRK